MRLNEIKGNDRIIERLMSAIQCGRISHAYIMEGDACVDKLLIADCFAKAILCETNVGCDTCMTCNKINHGNHEDIVYVETDGSSVKDEAIEELQARLKKKPYAAERSVAIIKDADTMTPRAQNRLLKTLEEPTPGTVILLLSENVENLAKTILSRCVVYHWSPFQTPEYGDLIAEAQVLVEMLMSREPFYKAKARIMMLADCKENAYKLLDAMEITYGNMFSGKNRHENEYEIAGIKTAIVAIEEARRDLRRGMNLGYTLKSMILSM